MKSRFFVAGAAVGALLAGCGQAGPEIVASDGAPPPSPVVRSVEPSPTPSPSVGERKSFPPPLSAATLRRIQKRFNFDIALADPAKDHPRISAARMAARVAKNYRGEAPAEMSLVRVHFGDHLFSPEGMTPAEAREARRQFERGQDRLAWAMLYEDESWLIRGGPPRDRTNGPCCYTADAGVFYDAMTGEGLRAGSM